MGLINLQTNLRSVSWGGERPYITRDINNPPPSNILAQQGTRRIDDTQRITKMIGDTPGIRFVGNQALLLQTSIGSKVRDIKDKDGRTTGGAILQQIGNTVSETAGTLASTIAQTPVSGTGVRFFKGIAPKTYLLAGTNREGFPTFTSGDSVIGSQFILSGRSNNIPLTSKTAGGDISSVVSIRSTRIKNRDGSEIEDDSKTVKYVDNRLSFEKTNNLISSPYLLKSTAVDNKDTVYQIADPVKNNGDLINISTAKKNRPLGSTLKSILSLRDENSSGVEGLEYREEFSTESTIDRRNKLSSQKPYIGVFAKGVEGLNIVPKKLNLSEGQEREVGVDKKPTELKRQDEDGKEEELKKEDLNYNGPSFDSSFPSSSSEGLSDFRKETGRSYSLNYSDSNIRKESRVRLGNQGKKITINPDKLWATVDQDTVDKLNALNVQDSSLTLEQTRDFISLNFEVITPDDTKYLYFRAYLDNFSDDYTGNWANVNYIGRGESMKAYEGFSRGVSLGFKVAASTRSEMRPIYEKINYLASATAPTYGDGTFMRGTIVRVTVGDYLHRVPAILENVSFTWQVDYPWEISMANPEGGLDDDIQVLPHVLDCSVTLGIIHNFIPQTGKVPYISNPVGNSRGKQAWTALPRETV